MAQSLDPKFGIYSAGLALDWKYDKGHVDVSMPGYIAKMLHKFHHPKPTRTEQSPYVHTKLNYGPKFYLAVLEDTADPRAPKDANRLQKVIGSLLFYGWANDSSILVALGMLASAQTKATINTDQSLTKLLSYCTSKPEAAIRFHASNMVMYVSSDTSYLSEPKARRRAAGFFYLSSKPRNPTKACKTYKILI